MLCMLNFKDIIFATSDYKNVSHVFIQVRNEFVTTEKMSTYLVAFVICDFALSSEQTPTHNITVSVIAAKDKLDQADFALHTAAKITEHYEKYFGIRYPLPKQGRGHHY